MIVDEFPKWSEILIRKFKAKISNSFILHFNINDYVESYGDYFTLKDFLKQMFGQKDLLIFYNISSGIRCLRPVIENEDLKFREAEKEFKELIGFKAEQNSFTEVMGGSDQSLPKKASSALPLIEKALMKESENSKGIAVIIEHLETITPNESGAQTSIEDRINAVFLQEMVNQPSKEKNIIIMLTSNIADIHPGITSLDSGAETIPVPKPDIIEREKYISHLATGYEQEMGQYTAISLSHLAAGLSLKQIEDVFLQARESSSKISPKFIKARKEDIFRQEYAGLLEIMDPQHGLESIGELEKPKASLKKVIKAMKEGNSLRVPMGALFTGAPGTGKTVMAEAIAKESEFNFVKLGSIRSKWYGSSEARQEKAFLGIKSLMPVVVFMDELDQTEGQSRDSNSNHEVSKRMFGKLLAIMSDTTLRGKVLWAGASNRPDLMDPALKRPGRFDLKIPFLCPRTCKGRVKIFEAIKIKHGYEYSFDDFTPFADKINGYNGSEIEELMRIAFNHSQDEDRDIIEEKDLQFSIEDFIPAKDERAYQMMEELAIRECSSRSLLPDDYVISSSSKTKKIIPAGREIVDVNSVIKSEERLANE